MATPIPRPKTLTFFFTFLLAVFISLVSNSTVSASSVYDSALKYGTPTSNYIPQDPPPTGVAPDNICKIPYTHSYGNWYSLISEVASGTSNDASQAQTFLDSLANPTAVWAMTQSYNTFTGKYVVNVHVVRTNAQKSLTWEAPSESYPDGRLLLSTGGTNNRQTATFSAGCNWFANDDEGRKTMLPNFTSWSTNRILSGDHTNGNTTRLVFISGDFSPNYPAGYEGELVQTEMPDEEYYSQKYTDFDVFTNSFSVRASYRGNEYDDSRCTYIIWRAIHVQDPEDIYDPEDVQEYYTKIDEELTLTAPESGFYRIDATWAWAVTSQEFEQSGLSTSNSSYCASAVVVGSGHISEALEQNQLPMNSGKVFPVDGVANEVFGYSQNRECYIDDQSFYETGFRPPTMLCIYTTSWTLKDCSAYGIDELHTRIGCEFGNFTKQLRSALVAFFVPNPSKIRAIFTSLTNDIQNQTSFLTYPMTFVITTIEGVTSQEASCSVNYSEIFGNSGNWNLCQVKDTMPNVWNFATTVFRATLVLIFIMAVYRAFMKLWDKDSMD